MDTKCPLCEKKAQLNEEMSMVHCDNCGYEEGFDKYMERMKERAISMATEFMEGRNDSI